MMTDPIADMLTRIRNANMARLEKVDVPASKLKIELTKILKEKGYVKSFKVLRDRKQGIVRISLKYINEREQVITGITKVSKPGRRIYVDKDSIPRVMGGYGMAIVSTSKGVMTDDACRREGVGGELICNIW